MAIKRYGETATYLAVLCMGTIAFLVFVNSSSSFIITKLIKQQHGIGDATGNLGFADEAVAIVLCPIWGLASDQMGSRNVTVAGFLIVAASMLLHVRVTSLYPGLLLARMLFSCGGAALSTMITALLPAIVSSSSADVKTSTDDALDETVTADCVCSPRQQRHAPRLASPFQSPSRVAGCVGFATGLGALIALLLLLQLPVYLRPMCSSDEQALIATYVIASMLAAIAAILCFVGFGGHPHSQDEHAKVLDTTCRNPADDCSRPSLSSAPLRDALHDPNLYLAFFGGSLARLSSVTISTFIPLFINNYYVSSGHCRPYGDPSKLLAESARCNEAYSLSAKLTGTSQTAAIIFSVFVAFLGARADVAAHIFGLFAALCGAISYYTLSLMKSPGRAASEGGWLIYMLMILSGVSQIGAVLSSLTLLARSVQTIEHRHLSIARASIDNAEVSNPHIDTTERETLLVRSNSTYNYGSIKGRVAGIYGFFGAAGIMFLNKIGGLLFDEFSPTAPFLITALFNSVFMVLAILVMITRRVLSKTHTAESYVSD